jgi:hypothetical protein
VALGSRTWRKKHDRLPPKKQISSQSSTKLVGKKSRLRLCATVAPVLACPRLVLCPNLSRVSPFTIVLTCLSSIAMGTKGFWWEHDGIKKEFNENLMGTRGIWWELFGNLMRTKGYWWVIDESKRNLMGTFWKFDGNKRNLMNFFWELDENKRILMGYWWELFGNLMGNEAPTPSKK